MDFSFYTLIFTGSALFAALALVFLAIVKARHFSELFGFPSNKTVLPHMRFRESALKHFDIS